MLLQKFETPKHSNIWVNPIPQSLVKKKQHAFITPTFDHGYQLMWKIQNEAVMKTEETIVTSVNVQKWV